MRNYKMKGTFVKIKPDYWIIYAGQMLIIPNGMYKIFKKHFKIKDKKTGELELLN